MNQPLEGQSVLVTGGNGGIGQGIARGMVEAGAQVTIIGRAESVHEVASELSFGKHMTIGIQADLSRRDQLVEAFEEVVQRTERVDVLVNCHGTVFVEDAVSYTMEMWDATLETNLSSVFSLCRLAAQQMIPRGRGKIINIASMYYFFGGLKVVAYTASKAGVAQMTKALCNEWASLGINVNAIAPGYIKTSLNPHVWSDPVRSAEVVSRIPAARWGEPSDLAGPSVFLASAASDYLNGVVLPVDGGFMAR